MKEPRNLDGIFQITNVLRNILSYTYLNMRTWVGTF